MGVARWLIARGYEVFHVRMLLAPDSPDPLIAFIANREGLMVVTHDSDFRNITDLLPTGERSRFRTGAGRIVLRVNEAYAVERLEAEWDSVLFHHAQAEKRNIRCLLTITNTGIVSTTNSTAPRLNADDS